MKRELLAILFSLAITSVSEIGLGAIDQNTKKAAAELGAKEVTEIKFDKNSSSLNEKAQKDLENFVSNAKNKGDVSEIRVVAWADQEYPEQSTTIADSQTDLAQNRADSVQNYIETKFNISQIKTFNMAKRPGTIQEALNTDDAKTKNTLEKKGAAPTTKEQTGFFNLKGKSSHVVIMVSYNRQYDNPSGRH